MPCDGSISEQHKRNFVCQKRNTNTDLMEITSDGVTFETMDTKLPSKEETFSYTNLFKNPFSAPMHGHCQVAIDGETLAIFGGHVLAQGQNLKSGKQAGWSL